MGSEYHTDQQINRLDTRPRNVSKNAIVLTYAVDWVITVGLGAAFFALSEVSGYKREFSIDDISLRHSRVVNERIPSPALYMLCIVAPIALQGLVNFFTVRLWLDAHHSTLGVILSLALTNVVTQFTKVTVGRPRPDVLDRCGALSNTVDPLFKLSSIAICTQTDRRLLEEGFRSFPSQHSSLSFAGLGFLSFYLAGKLHLYRLPVRGHAVKAWICMSPLCAAVLVSITRTMDYRSHWHDVVAGGILGLVISYLSYRIYYPPLTAQFSHLPLGPRVPEPLSNKRPMLPVHSQLSSLNGDAILRGVHAQSNQGHSVTNFSAPGHGGIEVHSRETLNSTELARSMPRVWKETQSEASALMEEEEPVHHDQP